MPAPLFKRFAPPTPATVIGASPPATTLNSREKSKKNKSAEALAAPAEDTHEDVAMTDVPTPKIAKKTKKRKSEVVEEQNEDVSKKHKAVFTKFERVSKLAEARKDEIVEEIEDTDEELHGKATSCVLQSTKLTVC